VPIDVLVYVNARMYVCVSMWMQVLLGMLAASEAKHAVRFVHYAQSSKATRKTDSSVSYAAAVVTLEPE
jgi:predicted class III extradiol MEMO1 family dioxygenase